MIATYRDAVLGVSGQDLVGHKEAQLRSAQEFPVQWYQWSAWQLSGHDSLGCGDCGGGFSGWWFQLHFL